MNVDKLLLFLEAQRVAKKVHKATLCSQVDISTTYYNQLINGSKNPAFSIVIALCNALEYDLFITPMNLRI